MSAEKQFDFKYSLPQPPKGKLVELSYPEIEEVLQANLRKAKDDPKDAMWELARFYSHSKQHEKALDYLRRILDLQPDTDHKAATVLAMGQTMEQVGDYESAVRYYREAFAFEPVHTRTWYFINNNLGFSLNMLGKFEEGERSCRAAIEIDGQLPNGFKNLGIAMRGQGRFAESAACFVQATQMDASDARSVKLLEGLLEQHPELELEFGPHLEICREAVEMARNQRALSPQPVIQRGWHKRIFLLRTRIASCWRRLWKRS
jgi:tetratricopeptide (TPR) repeat protein